MKKRVLCIALVVVLLFSLSMSAFAAQSDVSIVIDNKEVEFTASSGEPFVDANGRTQVPLRVVMEQYGCDVEWDSANNAAVITKGNTTVIVPIGQSYILVNGKSVAMDTAALVQNGRTYLPIRAVLEAFGADVEWDNGKVSVTSPASGEFENIYIDENGNLIFELANGNKINAGSVSNGKDGKDGRDGSDGVSVVNAYVDGSGNLMIALSNGRTINAGNVGVGGSMSGLTFADYSVGTKFYLTQPTGAFDVTVYVENTPYVVEFDSVYYELTAKHSYNDADAWKYGDGNTTFQPYDVTMKISGQTSAALAGKYVTVTFSEIESGSWWYKGLIAADGTIQIIQAQDAWRAPKNLMLSKVVIDNGTSTPGGSDTPSVDPAPYPDDDEIPAEILEMIDACAGDWASWPDDVVTLKKDGTLIYKGTEYTPEYDGGGDELIARLWDEGMAFIFDIGDGEMIAEHSGKVYYKGRTWETVTLTLANWFDYYELKTTTEFVNDAFGDYDHVSIGIYYVLKSEYATRMDTELKSTVDIKYGSDASFNEYTVNALTQKVSLSETTDTHYVERTRSATYNSVKRIELEGSYLDGTSGSAYFYTNTQLVNAQGTLYLINN